MDTNRIKKFATEARNILKRGIAAKIMTLGFDSRGNVPESQMPQLMQGGSLWNGQLETESFYNQWLSLYHRVQTKGINEVYEEAAYTWFNRLMAIRILQKNGLCEPVMEYADAARTPRIVNEARMGNLPQMPEEVRRRLMDLLDDDTKVSEQFAVLVTAWCHQNPIIQNCFGGIKDYTELLLPANILSEGGFVDMVNHTEFITDDDYASAELIGWLYQFYISERKDEVFAKKGKFEADEIPAATQIFTPNWIVKYMVQNTVGRIYLDNNPYAAEELKPQWKYLVEPSEPTPEESIYHYEELTDLKVADLACGSGHILNECFDLLYGLYISEAYSRSEAIENIFRCNLTGIDLDNRAKQMAQFSLLIKACQKDNCFADAHCMPNVLTMPEKRDEKSTTVADLLHDITFGVETPQMIEEIEACYDLMQDADSLGSIMKFPIGETSRLILAQTVEHWENETVIPAVVEEEMPRLKLILALTEKYSALVMNPPYMGGGNMNEVLSKYVKIYYEEGKADLATVFVQLMGNKTNYNGSYAFIIPPSWMFLSTFESLRKNIITNQSIQSLLHLSRGVFGADFGAVSTVIKNKNDKNSKGTYFRLVERTFQEFDQNHLRMLFEQTLENHDFKFSFKDYSKDTTSLLNSEEGNTIYYPNILQNNFKKIPGLPIGYWFSDNAIDKFITLPSIDSQGKPSAGLSTTDDKKYLRLWHEVNAQQVSNFTEQSKWTCISKGGSFRKWYGNMEYVVYWRNNGEDLKKHPTAVLRNLSLYFSKEGVSWPDVCSSKASFRYFKKEWLFNNKGPVFFPYGDTLYKNIAFLNSKVAEFYLELLAPTIAYNAGAIGSLPFLDFDIEESAIQENIKISEFDWDAHETSWDFKRPELLSLDSDTYIDNINYKIEEHYRKTGERICIDPATPDFESLEWCYNQYCQKWERLFRQLHANEEELNRQFINIYGLQDELTPDVPINEVTILQQGEITIADDNEIQFNGKVLMKQLISYAVGIWMGRYRLDKPGLHIAHPEPTVDELSAYTFHDETVYIDDDGIIPILPSGCPFDDNLASRVADFIRIVFGEERLTENLNFIEQQLGTTIEQYLLKDFWKDHKKMYQNRPIYWLFSSKKGAFKCLTYMHRMTPYTAERVRAKYLLPYIEKLSQQVNDYMNRAASLSTAERRQMDSLRKILEECNEYHDRLQVLAEDTERTSFDLDDGVVVNYAKYGDVLAKLK